MIDVQISKEVYEGYGIGFVDRRAVFVPNALKDEIVRGIPEKRGSVYFLYDYTLLQPSTKRIAAPCPHFGKCGGCSYQHLEYEDELEIKRNILNDSLIRIAKVPPEEIETVSANRFYYRSHATFVCDGTVSGFFLPRSHTIMPLGREGCMLCDRAINERRFTENPSGISMRISTSYDKKTYTDRDKEQVTEFCAGITYKHNVGDFFQSNIYLREALLSTAIESAQLNADDRLCDLGCGCGFFSLYASRFCKGVTGIDIEKGSILSAKNNAVLNKVSNVEFHAAAMKDISLDAYNVIVTDPPRSGLDSATVNALICSKASRVIYVSCNPATWARDLSRLVAGGYRLAKTSLFDMFPCTYHIETLSVFVR